MKTKNLRELISMLNDRMDSDRLCELDIQTVNHTGGSYTPDYRLDIYGESEAIIECVLSIYGELYELDPDKLKNYTIITTPTLQGNVLLQITDIEQNGNI